MSGPRSTTTLVILMGHLPAVCVGAPVVHSSPEFCLPRVPPIVLVIRILPVVQPLIQEHPRAAYS